MITKALNKKLPAWLVAGVLVLTMLAGVAMAARYESLTVYKLYARDILPWGGENLAVNMSDMNVALYTPLNHKEGALTWATGVGFSMPAIGSLFTFDVTAVTDSSQVNGDIGILSAGVTIVLGTPTAANHLEEWTFAKTDSGATVVVFYGGGLPFDSASGTTNINHALDAAGDVITVIPNYNGGVSYIVKSSRIH